MKLTTANIGLPEGKTDHIDWDDELTGFGLRLGGRTSGRDLLPLQQGSNLQATPNVVGTE